MLPAVTPALVWLHSTIAERQCHPSAIATVVTFELLNFIINKIKFTKFNCYRKILCILNIVTMLNSMQYNALQQGSWLLRISIIGLKVTLQFTEVYKSSSSIHQFLWHVRESGILLSALLLTWLRVTSELELLKTFCQLKYGGDDPSTSDRNLVRFHPVTWEFTS